MGKRLKKGKKGKAQLQGTTSKLSPDMVSPNFKNEDFGIPPEVFELISKPPVVHKRRKKTNPIAVTGNLCFRGISAKISALSKDWSRFNDIFLDNPESIGWEVYNNFILPALGEISKKPLRGKHKKSSLLITEIKLVTAWLYPFMKYWCRQPDASFPDYLKRLIYKIKKEDLQVAVKNKTGKYDPLALTAYCIQEAYGKQVKESGLKPFFEFEDRESLENFRITYVAENKRVKVINEKFIKNKSPEEIKPIAYHHPLYNTFNSLKLL